MRLWGRITAKGSLVCRCDRFLISTKTTRQFYNTPMNLHFYWGMLSNILDDVMSLGVLNELCLFVWAIMWEYSTLYIPLSLIVYFIYLYFVPIFMREFFSRKPALLFRLQIIILTDVYFKLLNICQLISLFYQCITNCYTQGS